MPLELPHRQFNAPLTPWHITFGTYGTRLHGAVVPTVDKKHNQRPEQFLSRNVERERSDRQRMRFPPRFLTIRQRLFAESELAAICNRGGWDYRVCAAGPDHVHLLCDVQPDVHGEKVRRLIKRWLGQALSGHWPLLEGATWWAEEGSNIAICDEQYLNNCYAYIFKQRATPTASRGVPAPE
jgi:REP element-mobilizing transposase RayT